MVNLGKRRVIIDGKTWRGDKGNYPYEPVIYSGVKISFGGDSCSDHPEPSTASLSMWLPKDHASWLPKLGQSVKVEVKSPGRYELYYSFFYGVIDSVKLVNGVLTDDQGVEVPGYRLNISCSDLLAVAGRSRVGAKPWPREKIPARVANINAAASGTGVTYSAIQPFGYDPIGVNTEVRERDVDHFSPLELFQTTVRAEGCLAISAQDAIRPRLELDLPAVLVVKLGEQVTVDRAYNVPAIPTGAIEYSAMELDATKVVDTVKVGYYAVYPNSGDYSSHEEALVLSSRTKKNDATVRSIDTDHVISRVATTDWKPVSTAALNALGATAELALAAQRHPRWRLADGLQILLSEYDLSQGQDKTLFLSFLSEEFRFGACLYIDGETEFLDSYQRVTSGEIVLAESDELTLNTEPADYSGTAAMTIGALTGQSASRTIHIGQLKSITADSTRLVSKIY